MAGVQRPPVVDDSRRQNLLSTAPEMRIHRKKRKTGTSGLFGVGNAQSLTVWKTDLPTGATGISRRPFAGEKSPDQPRLNARSCMGVGSWL